MDAKALAEALYSRFANRDIEAMLELIRKDVEWVNEPKDIHIRGKEQLRSVWMNPNPAAKVQFDILSVEPNADGMLVTVQEKVWMDGELIFDGPVGHRYTVRDGLVARCDIVDV